VTAAIPPWPPLTLDACTTQVAEQAAGQLLKKDEQTTSAAWNKTVHAADSRFEFAGEPQTDEAVIHGIRMFAAWYSRQHLFNL
jgi:hypothetical protein